jgi:pilus assembly protein TadC
MQQLKKTAGQVLELIKEAEQYHKYREGLGKRVARLFHEYQSGKHTYFEYKELLSKLVKGKSKEDWEEYYSSYLYQIMKKIELLNSKLFYSVYDDKTGQRLKIGKHIKLHPAAARAEKMPKEMEVPMPRIAEERVIEKTRIPVPGIREEKQPFFPVAAFRGIAHWMRIHKKEPASQYILEGTKKLFGLKEEGFIGEKISVPEQVMKFRKLPAIVFEEELPVSSIAEEASRIKKLMVHRKELEPYRPSAFGTLANLTIRKASFYLIDSFPEFFRYLYNSLRLANIKMLSNTYVNVMVFMSLFATIITFPIFILFFAFLGNPFLMVMLKSFLISVVAGGITFFAFYYYPYSRVAQRAKNIKANLPFAINHMAAVAASGVPPVKMFKLIAQSKEYGEISTEIEKIVEYIELFGYDLLTALKSAAATTPSEDFKEYMDGIVSNIESGSDIKVYMNEKSKEALLEYELERQKYSETISTYSDIYTGILIAAPLFFVAALSLVSILGGVVGGIPVDTLIVIGTYLIIPLLNIGFLVFLQFTQPEV